MADEFKLGPPLLRQGADCVPLDWRAALLKQLDGPSATSFAAASRDAHQWLLHDWPAATLRFRVRAADTDPAGTRLPDRFRKAQQQLSQRSARPTTSVLQQSGPLDADWWQAALEDVPTIPAPPTLTLSVQLQHIPAPLLARLGVVFSGISKLHIGLLHDRRGSTVRMPAPSALPGLRHFRVDSVRPDDAGSLWASVGPFVPQLTTLLIAEQPATPQAAQRQMCAALFSDATRSRALRMLTLPCALTPGLTALLQQYVPSLEELTVMSVSGDVGADADDPTAVADHCSWHTLAATSSMSERIPASAWEWVPVPAKGKVTIRWDDAEDAEDDGASIIAYFQLPLTDKVRAKLSHVLLWGIDYMQVHTRGLAPTEQCAALRDALPLLQPRRLLHEDSPWDCELAVRGITLTPELAAELRGYTKDGLALFDLQWPSDVTLTTPLPPLMYLGIAQTLDDIMLDKLVSTVPSIKNRLYVPRVRLHSSLPPTTRCPFEKVQVDSMSVTELLDNVDKLGGAVKWDCEKLIICVGPDQVACVPGWVEQLSSSQLVAVGWLEINAPEEDMPDEAAVLRASLALLAAFPCKPTNLTFKGWSVTTETVMGELAVLAGMDVLSELYRFIFRLHSTHAIPPAPYPIASLPGYIQSIASVQEWCIDARYLHSREVRAFLDSAPTDRTNESALTIVVQGKSEEWGARKHAEFLRSGEHPYVTIVGEPL